MSTQALPTKGPITRSSSTPLGVGGARLFTAAVTVAGVVPTPPELSAALVSAYAGATPLGGDVVNLTVGGQLKLRATVNLTGSAAGLFQVAFAVSGTTYYGLIVQTGLY
jgi:hypothetical protein